MNSESWATGSSSNPRAYNRGAQEKVLRSGGASVAILLGIASLVITAVLYVAFFLPLQNTQFGALFVKRGGIPYAIVWFTAWSICILVVKAIQCHREKRYLNIKLLPQGLAERITRENADQFSEHIRSRSGRISSYLLPRRLLTALEHFKSRGDAKEIADLLDSQAGIDAGTLESSYALIKVFIWAIPILGFIGTVVGISEAVQGFSESIGQAQEMDVIQKGLGIVTTGLAKAFDTTLVALVMSMLVMFPANWLQKEEEELLANVDTYCSENLLRRMDDESARPFQPEEIKQAVVEAFREHKSEIDVWVVRLNEVGTSLRDQVASGWTDIHDRMRQLQQHHLQEIKTLSGALTEQQKLSVNQLKELQTAHVQQCSTLATAMKQTAAHVQQDIVKMQESQVRSSQDVVAVLKGDLQTLQQDARQAYASMVTDVTDVTRQSMEALRGAVEEIRSTQAAAAGGLHDTGASLCERIERLTQSVEETAKAQLGSLADMQKTAESNAGRFTLTMESAQSVHTKAMVDAAEAFQSAVRSLLAQLIRKQNEHLDHLKQVSESTTGSMRAAQQDLSVAQKAHVQAVNAAQEVLASAGSDLERRAAEQTAHLSAAAEKIVTSLASVVEQAFKAERQKATHDTTVHLARVSKVGNDLVSSLVQSQKKLDEHITSFTRIVESHQQLNALQGALVSNLETLSASDSFKQTLSQINTSLNRLGIVLDNVGEKAGILWPEGTPVGVREAGLGRRLFRRLTGGSNNA